MNRNLFARFIVVSLLFALLSNAAFAQKTGPKPPRQEKLLNGLKVLIWSGPASQMATVKVRIHAGSSFDPQSKEGVMKMLAEAIFPNRDARDFYRDDLGGGLEIISNYDYIQINAWSRPAEFLTMIETLAGAISSPQIDKDTTAAVKTSALNALREKQKDSSYMADEAIAKRLFGTFPYGRPEFGTEDSLAKIDFADLRFSYDRLFGADNATIAISGNVNSDIAYRAVRRYFGAWLKSDKRVPSTFRQPEAPESGFQNVVSPETDVSEIRFAVRGLERADKDHAASRVFAFIFEERLKAKVPAEHRSNIFVRNYARILPGSVVIGIGKIKASDTTATPNIEANIIVSQALGEKITDAEFASAKQATLSRYESTDIADRWLDVDTFRIVSAKAEQDSFTNVTLADVQRVADRLRAAPMAAILMTPPKPAE
ncbi:MAG: M16 family metallopeptidase [Blastocatellia bacterium]